MRKSIVPVALAATLVAVPAWADKPVKPEKQDKHAKHVKAPKAHHCTPKQKSYVAGGDLVTPSLTLGSDGTYSGMLSVTVKRANRHARPAKGTTVSYTLTGARVRFHGPDRDANGTVDAADLLAGDRVKVHGRVAVTRKQCPQPSGSPSVVTVRKVTFTAPAGA